MKIAFELEFPDEQAADAFRWLQNLPAGWAARWKQRKVKICLSSFSRSFTAYRFYLMLLQVMSSKA